MRRPPDERCALYALLDSPLGRLRLVGDEDSIWSISLEGQRWAVPQDAGWREAAEPFEIACRQLQEYFAGERRRFDLRLRLDATPFRERVWRALAAIPFGATRTYGELAAALGQPGAARAVGLANGRNPFAIVLPCHRVIGSGGALVGYGGGLERKAWLLRHEAAISASR
jgi:methylated-DNA-[protein]-cysteine S-methyltransferase